MPHGALIAAIRGALAGAADPARASQQQRYMKSAMPYRGLTTPMLRSTVRSLLGEASLRPETAAGWRATIVELWDEAAFREERYAALAVSRARVFDCFRAGDHLDLWRHLVVSGAWWDLVDEVATHLVRDELLGDPLRVSPVVRAWSTAEDLWLRRAAIIGQVGAGTRVDLDLLRSVIVPNLEHGGKQDFFVRKGIGWALRDASYRHPDWVVAFVDEHRSVMAGLTIREALKQIDRAAARS